MSLGDSIEQHATDVIADAVNRLQTVLTNVVDRLAKAADDRLPIVDNEIRSLQLWLKDESGALIADLHGLLDRLDGTKFNVQSNIEVSVHVPERKAVG